jgi:hypothetical protein
MISGEKRRKLEELFAQHADHRLAKYFDIDWEEAVAVERCERYGLANGRVDGDCASREFACTRPRNFVSKNVLDLGGGLGYFAAEVWMRRHFVLSVDLNDELIHNAAMLLGTPLVSCPIHDQLSLLDRSIFSHQSRVGFDLIAMHRVNVEQDGRMWDQGNLFRFGEQVLKALRPWGEWHIDPNENFAAATDMFNLPAWEEWLAGRGTATIDQIETQHPRSIAGPGKAITITKAATL